MIKFIKHIIDRLPFLISVPTCVNCGERLDYEDRCLCKECKKLYDDHKQRNCSRCSKILNQCSCSIKYLESHYVKKLVKVYRYSVVNQEIPSNKLIYSLKRENREDVFSFLADELTESIQNSFEINDTDKFVVSACPRRPVSIRKYGYDHSEQIAKRVAKRLGLKYHRLFKNRSKKEQKKTMGSERKKVLKIDYHRSAKNLSGKTLILIDDIVTTGSSMASSATLARGLGIKKIIGASIAVAYKDYYIKREIY